MITLLLTALALSAAGFFAVWWISLRVKNYSFLDVAFSYGVAVLAPLYALEGPGDPLRKWLITALGVAWSLRLGTYILLRVLRHHPEEDVRYASLRERWPGPLMFLAFFELQAVLVVVFSLPFLLVSFHSPPGLSALEITGLALGGISLGGEALADRQMKRFKADPANRGKVCQAGLWGWSRHPNYFFEFLIQVSFFLVAVSAPWGGITIVSPLLMLYFLLKVTGIPLTEEYAVKSKGDAYRDYQQRVSAFIPWPPSS